MSRREWEYLMLLETITREEFDRRLEQSTLRMQQERIALEAQAADLEDLIGRYSSVLERLEADAPSPLADDQRKDLRLLLNELAERTSAIAAAL
jgi:hypothetical protein